MFSVTNLLCDHQAGNERLRYGHRNAQGEAESTPRPVVVWAVTKSCNLRCVHCYASATNAPAPNELTHDEGIALLDDLAGFNVPAVLFSGGEPLGRPDILPLIRHARSLDLACTLSTNGLLIDDKMADNLAESGLKYAGISIDGVESRHDKLRGKTGAFRRTLAAIERCRKRGIKVGVRFTVHGLNVDDLDAIFDICVTSNVQRLCVYHLAYAGRADNMQKVDLSAVQIRKVVDRIFEKSQELHRQGIPLEVLTVDNHADAAYLLLQLEKAIRSSIKRFAADWKAPAATALAAILHRLIPWGMFITINSPGITTAATCVNSLSAKYGPMLPIRDWPFCAIARRIYRPAANRAAFCLFAMEISAPARKRPPATGWALTRHVISTMRK